MADPITTGPNPAPVEPTQDSATPDQLQAPAAPAPVQQVQLPNPAAPPVTTPPVPPSPNQRLHSFVSSVLGGITNNMAGKGPVKYTTDTAGRVVADPNQPQESMGDKLRRIGAHALEGLGAGAQAGGKKSGLADALSGLGAGAAARTQSAQQQDDKAKKEARENEEAAQQKMIRMHDIARGNALTAATWQHMNDEAHDRDPQYQQNMGIFKNLTDAGIPSEVVTEDDINQLRQSDPEAIAKYAFLPIGRKPLTGPDGQAILNDDGSPKEVAQFAKIDGLHNGSLPAPASFVSDLQKYGKYAGVTGMDSLKAGDTMTVQDFIKTRNAVEEGKKKELEGWSKPELGWNGDTPIQINSNDPTQTRPFAPGVVPNAANKPESADAKNALTAAQTAEAKAKTQEAVANAAMVASQLSAGTGNFDTSALPAYVDAISKLPPQSQALLRAVRPQDQIALLKVAAGDADLAKTFPTRTTAKSGQMDAQKATTLVSLLNPDYNAQYFKAVQEATDVMTKGKGHDATLSFGQFLVHADDALQGSMRLARTNSPWINKPLNELARGTGNPEVDKLRTDIMAARSEWNTFIHNGHAPTKEEVDAGQVLMSDASTPAMVAGVFGEMGKQAVGRLDQVNEGYKTIAHRDWPNLVPPDAKRAATNLGLGDMVQKYGSGGTLRGAMGGSGNGLQGSGQPAAPSAQTPHEVIVGGKVVGYTTDGKTMTTTAPAGARAVGTAVQ